MRNIGTPDSHSVREPLRRPRKKPTRPFDDSELGDATIRERGGGGGGTPPISAATRSVAPLLDEHAAAAWTRLGASFNVPPATATPDLERLILDTTRLADRNLRLLIMAASWLASFPDYVAKRRLALLVRDELEDRFRPVLGFLLDWSQTHGRCRRNVFREALAHCRRAPTPGPLQHISRRNPALVRLAQQRASPLSRKWGCWMQEFELKDDALRPPQWIASANPSLALRAVTGGDLVATIAADALAGQCQFASESSLARRYGASRSAVRAALRKLALAGYAHQSTRGKSRPVTLSAGSP